MCLCCCVCVICDRETNSGICVFAFVCGVYVSKCVCVCVCVVCLCVFMVCMRGVCICVSVCVCVVYMCVRLWFSGCCFFSFTLGVEGQLTVTRLCTHIHAPVRASHPSRSGVSATYRWRASNKHEHNLDLHIYKGGKTNPKETPKYTLILGQTNQSTPLWKAMICSI